MKKIYCIIAVLGLFLLLAAPLAFAQDFNGLWFEVKLAEKGYVQGDNAAAGDKISAKFVNYVQFVYNTAGTYPFYEMHVYYLRDATWYYHFATSDLTSCLRYGGPTWDLTFLDKQFVTFGGFNEQWWFFENDGQYAWVQATVISNVKRKNGAVSSTTLTSEGCIAQIPLVGGDRNLGSCTIKGKLIKPEKLPDGIDPAGVGPQWVPAG